MHQLANKDVKASRKSQRLERLETEYQQNQQRIRQIHQRNQQLADQMRGLRQAEPQQAPLAPNNVAPISRGRKPKSLRRIVQSGLGRVQNIRWGKYSIEFWLQAAVLALGVALVCGSLSFMVTRLVSMLLGG
jgi:hypothetical protein